MEQFAKFKPLARVWPVRPETVFTLRHYKPRPFGTRTTTFPMVVAVSSPHNSGRPHHDEYRKREKQLRCARFLGPKLGPIGSAFFSPKRGLSCARSTKVLTAHNPKDNPFTISICQSYARFRIQLACERACCTISTKTPRVFAGLLTSRKNAMRAPRTLSGSSIAHEN